MEGMRVSSFECANIGEMPGNSEADPSFQDSDRRGASLGETLGNSERVTSGWDGGRVEGLRSKEEKIACRGGWGRPRSYRASLSTKVGVATRLGGLGLRR